MAHDNISTDARTLDHRSLGWTSSAPPASMDAYSDDATCAMALADFEALDLDPTVTPAPDAVLLKIDAADLRALLPLASVDETRYNLCGIHIAIDGIKRTITLVATDGHCLGQITRAQNDVDGMEHLDGRSFTLTREAVSNACKVAGRGKRAHPVLVECFTDPKRSTTMLINQTRITDCELSGQFPDYKQVVPKADRAPQAAHVALNLAIVARFVAMGELSDPFSGARDMAGAKITITDALSPVRLDFYTGVVGVVMPMRL